MGFNKKIEFNFQDEKLQKCCSYFDAMKMMDKFNSKKVVLDELLEKKIINNEEYKNKVFEYLDEIK